MDEKRLSEIEGRAKSASEGWHYEHVRLDALDLVAEVRRLQALLRVVSARPMLYGHLDPDTFGAELQRDFDGDRGEPPAPAVRAAQDLDAGRGYVDARPAGVAGVPVDPAVPHEPTVARPSASVDGGVPSVELAAALVRSVAVHGPIARAALECWYLDVPTHRRYLMASEEQRAAVAWLLARSFIVEHEGRVELRGLVGKERKPLSGAQVEAIESVVRLAVIAGRGGHPLVTMQDMLHEGVRGVLAARRADAEKKGGQR